MYGDVYYVQGERGVVCNKKSYKSKKFLSIFLNF